MSTESPISVKLSATYFHRICRHGALPGARAAGSKYITPRCGTPARRTRAAVAGGAAPGDAAVRLPPPRAIAPRTPNTPTASAACARSTGACASCASAWRAWSWWRSRPRMRAGCSLARGWNLRPRTARARAIASSGRTSSTWHRATSAWMRRSAAHCSARARRRGRRRAPGGARVAYGHRWPTRSCPPAHA